MIKIIQIIALTMVTFSATNAMDITTGDSMMKKDMMATETKMMEEKKMDTKMESEKMKMDSEMMDMYMQVTPTSKREDIAKLQMMLVEKGYLKMPRGVAYGYYGKLTKAAFAKHKTMMMQMKDKMN